MDKEKEEELIPVEDVLDDMYSDLGIISDSARAYYYTHYATEEEKREMDREDEINEIITKIAVIFGVIFIIIVIFSK